MDETSDTAHEFSRYPIDNYQLDFYVCLLYTSFMEMLTSREREDVLNKLRQIVMLGRQAGFFLILACQRCV